MRARSAVSVWPVLGLLGLWLVFAAAIPARAQPVDTSELDGLFAQLRQAPDAPTAKNLENRIWVIWLTPEDPDLAKRMDQVLIARRRMNLPIALGILNGVVHDFPTYAEGWNQRATVFYLLHDFPHALADIDKVLEFEPRHFGALSGRALIHLALNQRGLALRDISAALALHPFLAEKALFPELLDDITHI